MYILDKILMSQNDVRGENLRGGGKKIERVRERWKEKEMIEKGREARMGER